MSDYKAVFPKTDKEVISEKFADLEERVEWLETFVKGQEEVIQCLVEAVHHINNTPIKIELPPPKVVQRQS